MDQGKEQAVVMELYHGPKEINSEIFDPKLQTEGIRAGKTVIEKRVFQLPLLNQSFCFELGLVGFSLQGSKFTPLFEKITEKLSQLLCSENPVYDLQLTSSQVVSSF